MPCFVPKLLRLPATRIGTRSALPALKAALGGVLKHMPDAGPRARGQGKKSKRKRDERTRRKSEEQPIPPPEYARITTPRPLTQLTNPPSDNYFWVGKAAGLKTSTQIRLR